MIPGSLIEAVRDHTKTVDLKQVNAVLMQPHWRHNNLQIKRRTRVIGLFPNENSVLRLATAILMETSKEWETGKSYLTLTAPHTLKATPN